MSTSTTNYSFTLPAVADPTDQDLWGGELNTNFTNLDTILGALTASKHGAVVIQNNTDNGFTTITSQGTSGQVLTSNGSNTAPTWQSIAATVLPLVYPVGSYYINETDSTNPATLLGFGTWTAVTDKFIIGHGSTYTSTGGAATVTLTVNELPAHTHTMKNDQGGAGTANFIASAAGSATAVTTSSTGNGAAFSIIPPYQAAYIWKRTV